ncbi:uncharacterized protein HaLaN_01806 [Haematococcus lacustris]|uniref:Uncharacterized protein n=1 Tax=Haematococcus lacustris TaxID=44745 RepID=A0A699YLY6_HAELA|nr:uncharacterized protein HaLaN_01806 [Haematococcus lacustris]
MGDLGAVAHTLYGFATAPVGMQSTAPVASMTGGGNGQPGATSNSMNSLSVSIGRELARHGISVDMALQAGWLGTLSPENIALLGAVHGHELRGLAGMTTQQQPGSQVHQAPPPGNFLLAGATGSATCSTLFQPLHPAGNSLSAHSTLASDPLAGDVVAAPGSGSKLALWRGLAAAPPPPAPSGAGVYGLGNEDLELARPPSSTLNGLLQDVAAAAAVDLPPAILWTAAIRGLRVSGSNSYQS